MFILKILTCYFWMKSINKLDYFREKVNSSAHSIEVLVKKKNIDDYREEINHLINMLESLLIKIS